MCVCACVVMHLCVKKLPVTPVLASQIYKSCRKVLKTNHVESGNPSLVTTTVCDNFHEHCNHMLSLNYHDQT